MQIMQTKIRTRVPTKQHAKQILNPAGLNLDLLSIQKRANAEISRIITKKK